MADNIEQKISLTYSTNANAVGKDIDKLTDSQEASNAETQKTTEVNKTMKAQVREATQEMLRLSQAYGDTSKEAVEAAKKVANLKDQIEFSKDLVEGFNPDRKFQALSTAVNMAATAATGLTAGMALFGSESEDTQKALLKVQAAMAFSDSIGRITEMGDDFAKLKAQIVSMYTAMTTAKVADTTATEAGIVAENQNFFAKAKSTVATGAMTVATSVATAAQWLWNAAIMANPIVAVAVAIAAAVAGIYLLTKALMDSSAESEKASKANTALNKEVDALTKSSQKSSEQLEINGNQTIALAKASGKSAEEIRKLTLQLANQEVTEKRVNAVKAYSILLETQRVAGLEDSTDAQKETAKKALESYKAINTDYEKSLKDRNQVIRDNKVAEVQEETDRQKKLQDERNKANEERKKKEEEDRKERKARLEKEAKEEADRLKAIADKKLADEMKSAQEAMGIVKALQESNESPAQKESREYEAKKAVLEANNLSTEELTRQHKERLTAIELEEWAKEAEASKKRQEDTKARDEQAAADKIQTEKNINDSIISIVQNGISTIDSLEAIGLKKSKASEGIKKGFALTEIGINTAKAISSAIPMAIDAGKEAAKIAGPAAPVVGPLVTATSLIGSLATVAKNVAAAKKILGSGGGSGTTGAGAAPVSGSTAPQVGFQSSNANQIATTIADNTNAQPPIKAIVVANEVTTAQSANRNKIEANSI